MSKRIILDDEWMEEEDNNNEFEDLNQVETTVVATYYDVMSAETAVTLLSQYQIPAFIANAPSASAWGGANMSVRVHVAKSDYVEAQNLLQKAENGRQAEAEAPKKDYIFMAIIGIIVLVIVLFLLLPLAQLFK